MTRPEQIKQVIKIIKDNPGGVIYLDSGDWEIERPVPEGQADWTDEQWDDLPDGARLAWCGDYPHINYEIGLLEVLATMAGLKIGER